MKWQRSSRKSYNEYIIDPQVTVSLDKAMSYRYSVIGDVGQPGIRLMSKRITVSEAIGSRWCAEYGQKERHPRYDGTRRPASSTRSRSTYLRSTKAKRPTTSISSRAIRSSFLATRSRRSKPS